MRNAGGDPHGAELGHNPKPISQSSIRGLQLGGGTRGCALGRSGDSDDGGLEGTERVEHGRRGNCGRVTARCTIGRLIGRPVDRAEASTLGDFQSRRTGVFSRAKCSTSSGLHLVSARSLGASSLNGGADTRLESGVRAT